MVKKVSLSVSRGRDRWVDECEKGRIEGRRSYNRGVKGEEGDGIAGG